MSRVDDIADAQREVDAMLPGTPPIAPSPPRAIPGCVEVPADAPFLRARFGWHDVGFILSLVFTIVCVARAAIIYEIRARDADEHVLESIRERIRENDVDLRILRASLDALGSHISRTQEQLDSITREVTERQGAAEKPRGRR